MLLAVDTSVAIPLLVRSHAEHASVTRWWSRREVSLAGHAAVETYSVLTRLPGDARLAPADAAALLRARFGTPLVLRGSATRAVVDNLARLEIAGGAVYDALVALTAREHGASLATRDARAIATYERIGVELEIVR